MRNYLLMLLKKYLFSFFALILALSLAYLFCIMPNLSRKEQMQSFTSRLYAHRGLFDNTSDHPENSLPAFQRAVQEGYAIELDVQLTKDKVPIVIHDTNLERISGMPKQISQLTYAELSSYRIFDSKEQVPLLKDVLSLVDGKVPLMVELKTSWNYKETCQIVTSILDEYEGPYCIISFNPLALEWFKQNKPHVLRGQLATDDLQEKISGNPIVQFALTHLLTNFISRPDFISYGYKYSDNFSLKLCKHLFGTPIAGWTISSQQLYDDNKNIFDIVVFDQFIPIP